MLSFLKQVTIDATDVKKKTGGPRKAWNPVNADLRVWKSGAVYPSAELVAKFNLEYQPATSETPGNGFDVMDSNEFPTFKSPQRVLVIIPTDRKNGKIDLFSSVTFDEQGQPKSTVLDQGATTFGKDDLIPMLKEVYGIELSDDKEYVDLKLYGADEQNNPFTLPEGKTVTYIPKRVSRGAKKGEVTVVRRENPAMYVLYPVTTDANVAEAPAGDRPLEEAVSTTMSTVSASAVQQG